MAAGCDWRRLARPGNCRRPSVLQPSPGTPSLSVCRCISATKMQRRLMPGSRCAVWHPLAGRRDRQGRKWKERTKSSDWQHRQIAPNLRQNGPPPGLRKIFLGASLSPSTPVNSNAENEISDFFHMTFWVLPPALPLTTTGRSLRPSAGNHLLDIATNAHNAHWVTSTSTGNVTHRGGRRRPDIQTYLDHGYTGLETGRQLGEDFSQQLLMLQLLPHLHDAHNGSLQCANSLSHIWPASTGDGFYNHPYDACHRMVSVWEDLRIWRFKI